MTEIILVVHNVRSAYNVGSMLRTAEGIGLKKNYLTGYTPYPLQAKDSRLPHLSQKTDSQIAKTSLGAEKLLDPIHIENVQDLIADLKSHDYQIAALEQTPVSITLTD